MTSILISDSVPFLQLLGILGVIVNCALIGQSGLVQRIWPDLSWGGQILLVVVLEHVILASKMIIDILVPDVPDWVRVETAKQEHFRREAFKVGIQKPLNVSFFPSERDPDPVARSNAARFQSEQSSRTDARNSAIQPTRSDQ